MHAAENLKCNISVFWLICLQQQSALKLFVDKQCSINQVDFSRDVILSVFQGRWTFWKADITVQTIVLRYVPYCDCVIM